MAGLLDIFNTDEGRLGLGLLAGAAPSMQPQNLASRLGLAMQTFQGLKDQDAERQTQQKRGLLMDAQIGNYEAEAQAKRDERARAEQIRALLPTLFSGTSPGAFAPSADGMGPTMPQSMQTTPQFDVMAAVRAGLPPELIKAYAEVPNLGRAEVARTVEVDDGKGGKATRQLDKFGRPVADDLAGYIPPQLVDLGGSSTFAKPTAGQSFTKNDPNKAFTLGPDGNPVANAAFQNYELNKARAGAAKTSISVNTEKSLLNDVAGGLGKALVESRGGAQAALGTIGTVSRLFDALDTGKVMAGPGTTFRQYGLQVGNVLGVGGKDAKEKLLNTRQAIQSLAQLELDAAQQMKGQGQITEAERSIIRRAASGDIDGMTTGELRLLGGVLDRSARTKIRGYNSQVKPLVENPNAAPIAPFLTVDEPTERATPNVLRFDARGELVR